MRKKKFLLLIFTITFIFILFIGAGSGKGGGNSNAYIEGFTQNIKNLVYSFKKLPLDSKEKAGLLQMREEEKLARDVYLYLYDKWGIRIFSNIAKSEQQHMDAIKILLDRYGLKDPVISDIRGKFKNSSIQNLYNQLTKSGSKSALSALIVGATIEDLDIKDLVDLIKETDNKDIRVVYLNLEKGSRNHLRSFYRMIKSYNGNYSPKYISIQYFNKIINTPMERGNIISDPYYKF